MLDELSLWLVASQDEMEKMRPQTWPRAPIWQCCTGTIRVQWRRCKPISKATYSPCSIGPWHRVRRNCRSRARRKAAALGTRGNPWRKAVRRLPSHTRPATGSRDTASANTQHQAPNQQQNFERIPVGIWTAPNVCPCPNKYALSQFRGRMHIGITVWRESMLNWQRWDQTAHWCNNWKEYVLKRKVWEPHSTLMW